MPKSLTPRLQDLKGEIEGYARGFGLDFFETVFEVLSTDELNMVASYGGFPTRYPHWRWGMEFEQLSKSSEYGLSKIYELVINNDPCFAYLLEANAEVDQKLVMAHVYGHNDFFKNNFTFKFTNRKMVDEMANHGTRIRRWIDKKGVELVENFIDVALSLENLIDQYAPHIRRNPDPKKAEEQLNVRASGIRVEKEYMRPYMNPSTFVEAQQKRVDAEKLQAKKFPERPQRDVLSFLLEHAPLEDWERDIIAIVREEAYYFAPQAQTKIMNEGWASYWHSTIMTTKALRDHEIIDYADHHSGTMATQQGKLNPYKLGIELYRDIEDRWNKGRFGKAWDDCDDLRLRRQWDKKLGGGREKIFEVRKHYNDITFIDAFLTPEFAIAQRLFTFDYNDKKNAWEIISREFRKVKGKLLQQLTNFGQPIIDVVDANHDNKGELVLMHRHEGVDLDPSYSRETLKNLQLVWKRPVAIITKAENKNVMQRHDTQGFTEKKLDL
jgi:stage V sporulation protein R